MRTFDDPDEAGTLYVRTVVWYPHGEVEDVDMEPYVYVVLGSRRAE